MWHTTIFRTKEKMDAWIERNRDHVRFVEIAVENAWAVEWRPLDKMRMLR